MVHKTLHMQNLWNMIQQAEEPIRAYASRLTGTAELCDFTMTCSSDTCTPKNSSRTRWSCRLSWRAWVTQTSAPEFCHEHRTMNWWLCMQSLTISLPRKPHLFSSPACSTLSLSLPTSHPTSNWRGTSSWRRLLQQGSEAWTRDGELSENSSLMFCLLHRKGISYTLC